MAIQSQPSRIPEPFAGSGTKNTIPATNATPSASQAASWASGFPPECSQPISAGGCPVPRNDVNGALNQLSQDFAFRQDGGIWGWSALADYDTQRMVRGSDGLLYWSVAQSGPGFASGAVDPTTDDGTYWGSPALKTMPLGDKSTAGATTEWVKNLSVAPVYVDPAGDDANDGMSATNAVQTFAKAVTIAGSLPSSRGCIHIIAAAGTYAGGMTLDQARCLLDLLGDVTINGQIYCGRSSDLTVDSAVDPCTLTVNSTSGNNPVNCALSSVARFYVALNLTGDGATAIRSETDSFIFAAKNVALYGANSASNPVEAVFGGKIRFAGSVAVGASFVNGISAWNNSYISFGGTITFADGSVTSGSALYVLSSFCYIGSSGNSIQSGTSADSCITVDDGGSLIIEGSLSMIYRGIAAGYILKVAACSRFAYSNTGNLLYLKSNTSNIRGGIGCLSMSTVLLLSSGDISIDAAGTMQLAHLVCTELSLIAIGAAVQHIYGNVGPKVYCKHNSVIYTGGKAISSLPGSPNGTIDTGGYVGS